MSIRDYFERFELFWSDFEKVFCFGLISKLGDRSGGGFEISRFFRCCRKTDGEIEMVVVARIWLTGRPEVVVASGAFRSGIV